MKKLQIRVFLYQIGYKTLYTFFSESTLSIFLEFYTVLWYYKVTKNSFWLQHGAFLPQIEFKISNTVFKKSTLRVCFPEIVQNSLRFVPKWDFVIRNWGKILVYFVLGIHIKNFSEISLDACKTRTSALQIYSISFAHW